MKQGRPVQREAVLAGGAGDYSSMIYGDKENTQGGIATETSSINKEKVEKEVEKVKTVTVEPVSTNTISGTNSGTGTGSASSSTVSGSVTGSSVGGVVVDGKDGKDKDGNNVKKVAVTGSWAAMVAANASAASAVSVVTPPAGEKKTIK